MENQYRFGEDWNLERVGTCSSSALKKIQGREMDILQFSLKKENHDGEDRREI